MRAIDIDDALIAASRIQREAQIETIRRIRAKQRGEAFNEEK